MEEQLQQPLEASFPPAGTVKRMIDGPSFHDRSGDIGSGDTGGGSFAQDSGYTSYHSTTPNNTFNLSSRHGASCTLATIEEGSEDCSMNDSGGSGMLGAVGSNVLTPRTASSIAQMSDLQLSSPTSLVRAKRSSRRPLASAKSAFPAATTPERLPVSRSVCFESHDTPLRSVNRSSQHTQLTPHKTKAAHSMKRKHSSSRGKLYSDEDLLPDDASDENRSNGLNDSLDCKRLDDISPIPKTKRHKRNENITNLIRSSTPKTASSQPRFLSQSQGEGLEAGIAAPAGRDDPQLKRTLRKFQSFSPGKIAKDNRQKWNGGGALGNRLVGRTGAATLVRQDALRELELTPKKGAVAQASGGCATPSKENRVLAEIRPMLQRSDDRMPPMNMASLLDAPILEDPTRKPPADEQLEQAITTVPSFEDFSMTPSKANLIDPELSFGDGSYLASEDFVARRAPPNLSYGGLTMLNSIVEEGSPLRCEFPGGKHRLLKTPPSSCKSSVRKPKRLGTNSSSGSLKSPLRQIVRVPASPKVRRAYASRRTQLTGMYCGMNRLNILQRLYERNQDSLHVLLGYLTDADLVRVVGVSRGWREIIQGIPRRWKGLQKHLREQREDKENCHRRTGGDRRLSILKHARKDETPPGATSNAVIPPEVVMPGTVRESGVITPTVDAPVRVQRRPFKVCNSLDNSAANSSNAASAALFSAASLDLLFGSATMPERARRSSVTSATVHSPPVSPSKRQFYINQKVASHLKQSEQLRACPRCKRPSRIIFSRSSKHGQNKTRSSAVGARLEKSYTLPDPHTTSHHLNGTTNNQQLTLSAISHTSNLSDISNTDDGCRNNNDYSASSSSSSNLQCMNVSPNRVRKNLFNISASTNGPQCTVSASLAAKPSTKSQHPDTTRDNVPPMLRSAARSVDCSSSVSVEAARSVANSSLRVRDSKCDYAICSGQNCGFKFCIKCLCDYHPDTVCHDLSPNSPSKEEERSQQNVACSRQSRRLLQRMCS